MKRFAMLTSGLAAMMAAVTAMPAAAQYGPYQQASPYPQGTVAQQPVYQQPAFPPQPNYGAPVAPPVAYQQPAYGAPGMAAPRATAPRVAMQAGASLPAPTEAVPAAMGVTPGPMTGVTVTPAQPAASYPAAAPAPVSTTYPSYPAAPAGYAGDSYMAAGCSTGSCATGDCGTSVYGCDTGAYCAPVTPAAPRRQFFLGLYGLYMGRDNPGKATSVFLVDGAPAGTYYPDPGTDVLFATSEADVDFTGGGEIRVGTTFGCGTDPCTGCAYQPFAWEMGYWGLAEDSSVGEIVDDFGGTTRIYSQMNYAGLEYDRDGSGGTYGYRPVNDYYDYQKPIDSTSTNDIRVLAVRVRQSFYAQNLELNFWRFGTAGVGAGLAGGCGTGLGGLAGGRGCGAGACGAGACGAGACGVGACGAGCDSCGCGPVVRPQRFFLNGLLGVRYLQLDETFRNAVFFTRDDGFGAVAAGEPTAFPDDMPEDDNTIFHDVEVDNDLVGFQLGCSMNYVAGCRWTLFADTNFGVYNNHIDKYQRVFSPGGGTVRFVGTGENAAVRTSKDDVAFLGEIRTGVGYQVGCHCRLTAAYRVVAVSGVALAIEQVGDMSSPETFGHIDSNDSLVLHGFQGGVEFKY